MVRSYEDTVEVRGDAAAGPFRPRQFLWRGRLYVVRDVLSHWYERSAWWDGVDGRALRDEDGAHPEPAPAHTAGPGGVTVGAGRDEERRTDGLRTDGLPTDGLRGGEREVWRVEASAGRSAGSGVYDLCAVPDPRRAPSWRLLRVSD